MSNFSTASSNFAFDIYKEISKDEENVFLSPWSISIALSTLVRGANGKTRTELIKTLHLEEFKDQNEINEAFKDVIKTLSESTGCTLSTANRMYIKKSFKVEPDFKSSLQNHYKSKAVNVNFSDNVEKQINKWVASQTNHLIKDLFAPKSFNPETRLVLVNAIYFKGKWLKPFPHKTTGTFYLGNGDRKRVSLMNTKKSFNYFYAQQLECAMVQLLYKGKRLAMYVVLPDEKDGVGRLKEVLTADKFEEMRQSMMKREVVVTIPAFKMRFRRKLILDLKALKVDDVFVEGKSDLSGMTSVNDLFVSDVVHEAYVSVDETGTEAAAVTDVQGQKVKSCVEPRVTWFTANHPFVFVIRDNKTNVILFIGTLDNPNT